MESVRERARLMGGRSCEAVGGCAKVHLLLCGQGRLQHLRLALLHLGHERDHLSRRAEARGAAGTVEVEGGGGGEVEVDHTTNLKWQQGDT